MYKDTRKAPLPLFDIFCIVQRNRAFVNFLWKKHSPDTFPNLIFAYKFRIFNML